MLVSLLHYIFLLLVSLIECIFQSSRDILLSYAREFLCGVGDITKHLGYLDYSVSHKQEAIEEFDYAVNNLATDLRCGIRLT